MIKLLEQVLVDSGEVVNDKPFNQASEKSDGLGLDFWE